jgi:tetratricopeptide (TPR) repeat protein
MALNQVGLASCRLSKLNPNLRNAMDALHQSFSVRYELLGPTHVDTMDTLNNMAAVHLHLHQFDEARQAYFEVLTLRELIFGPKHPSVAVTAHCLGRVYMHFSEVVVASKYYHNALDIYRDLRLSEDNPTVVRLLTDIASLGLGTNHV